MIACDILRIIKEKFFAGKDIDIQINRWICRKYGRTISLLPSCIQPYLKLPTITLEELATSEDGCDADSVSSQDLERCTDTLHSFRKRLKEHNNLLYAVFGTLLEVDIPKRPWQDVMIFIRLIIQQFRGLGNALFEMVRQFQIAPFGKYQCHNAASVFIRKKKGSATGV